MNILRRIFNFNDEECVIGLCKFNDDFYRQLNAKQQIKKKMSKTPSLSEVLRKSGWVDYAKNAIICL